MADPGGALSICLVTTFYPPYGFGGDGVYVRRLAHTLAGAGHDVTVVHSIDAFRALSSAEPTPVEPVPGVTVHGIESRWPRGAALASYLTGRPAFYAGELRAAIGAKRVDVTHFHNVSLVGGPDVLRYRQRRQAVHHARALARLPDARAVPRQSRAVRRAALPALHSQLSPPAADLALLEPARAIDEACRPVPRAEQVHDRCPPVAWVHAADAPVATVRAAR